MTEKQALFSMPMFNWQTVHKQEILSPWLWIYWAVTLPLTVAVVLIWYIWIRRTDNLHRNEDLARANTFDHKTGQQGTVNSGRSPVSSRADPAVSRKGPIISSIRAQAPEQEEGSLSMRFRSLLRYLRAAVGLNSTREKQNIA